MEDHADNADDADSRYISRVLGFEPVSQSSSHQEFVQLQQTAANDGEALPPSTLRALIHAAAEDVGDGDGVSPSRSPARSPSHRFARAPTAVSSGSPSAEPAGAEALSLSSLPDCLLSVILGACDAPSLVRLAVTSHEFAALAASCDHELWRNLVTTRYSPVAWALPPGSLAPAVHQSWRALYTQLAGPGPRGWRLLAAASHTEDDDCWIVIGQSIYDVSEFAHRHPGGIASLRLFGGDDATDAFREVPHSSVAHRLMRSLELPSLRLPREDFPPRLTPTASPTAVDLLLERGASAALLPLPSLSDHFDKLPSLPELPSLSDKFDQLPSLSDKFDQLPSLSEKFDQLPSLSEKFDQLPSFSEKFDQLPSLSEKFDQLPSFSEKFDQLPSFSERFDQLPSLSERFDQLPSLSKKLEQAGVHLKFLARIELRHLLPSRAWAGRRYFSERYFAESATTELGEGEDRAGHGAGTALPELPADQPVARSRSA